MTAGIGIALAFAAMLCWGIGDFSIQRSTRRLGDWETLFVITLFGTLLLAPFVWARIPSLFAGSRSGLLILISAGIVLMCAALLHFEGFKKGKLSVLEPLLSFEIIAASFLSIFALGDHVTWLQILAIVILMVGLSMVSFRERSISKKFFLEKGVFLFTVGALLMGFADFLLGWGSRVTDPILANFTINVVMAVAAGVAVLMNKNAGKLMRDVRSNAALLLLMSLTDNIAWIAYAVAMTIVPIAVATGLSESSIVVAVLLGLFINKENLQRHQKIGLIISLVAVIALAVITSS
jgi:drug/metabolite transporter (DMT)-like permease